MNSSRLFSLAVSLSAGSFATATATATDWPSWRGPNQNGSLDSSSCPTDWSADKPAWKVALPGKGGSSPVVWDGTIIVTCPDGEDNAVLAFDMAGEPLWSTKLGKAKEPKHKKLGSSCNSSPVTDGKGIYVYFKSGDFAALEMDGEVRWRTNLSDEYGPENLYWDQGSSPVIVGDTVVLARLHGGRSWLAGFDVETGEMAWQQPRDYEVPKENDNGYTTPLIFDHHGQTALLVWCSDILTAHSAENGEVLWSCSGFNPDATGFWPAIASPLIVDGLAIVPVGRDDRSGQARMHAVKLGGEGDVTDTHHEWKRLDVGVFVPSPVEYQGKVYLLRNRGGVVCLDPGSGETVWEEEFPRSSANYYASPIIVGGVLYAAREDGTVFTANVEGGFEQIAEIDMGEQLIATPVPAGGKLLIRGEKHLFCIE